MSRDVSQTRFEMSLVERAVRVVTYRVNKMLINRSHPQPATKKAPAGGKTMVTRMRITSEALTAMSRGYGMSMSWLLCGVVLEL